MGTAKQIGLIGASAAALGVGDLRRSGTRVTVAIGAAALVVTATVAPASASFEPCKQTDPTCALILGGTTIPTPDDYYIDTVKNQFIAPTYPGQIGYDAVTTPKELWPTTGIARVLGLVLGPPELGGLDGPAWPDKPVWKLSGLFDLTADRSVAAGVTDLEDAIAEHPNDHLVIFGYSQGAGVATWRTQAGRTVPGRTQGPRYRLRAARGPQSAQRWLDGQVPRALHSDPRFFLQRPEPTDTQFDTDVITRKYDGFTDFPLYPLNLVAD